MSTTLEGGCGVSVTLRPLFTPGKDAVPIVQEAGWTPGPVWTGAENLARHRESIPADRPARSQSLYRLSYSGPRKPHRDRIRMAVHTTSVVTGERKLSSVEPKPQHNLSVNPLNPELNPICYLLALLGAHHFLHVSRIGVKLLTFRLLMSYIYIYGAPILDVSRSHTTTQHSR